MNELFPIFLLAAVAVTAVGIYLWRNSRVDFILRKWAATHELRLIGIERRALLRGPYFWTTSKGQVVCRITAETPDGAIRTGWARVGGWFIGLWSDAVEVRWDDLLQRGFPVAPLHPPAPAPPACTD